MQYRNLRCEIHETIFQGNIDQCKSAITYRHNIFLKMLRPNQIDMIRFINNKITEAFIEFQKSELQSLHESIDVSITLKLNNQYQKLYSKLDVNGQIQLQKSYIAWLSHRNQTCLLLNSRNIIRYNYCVAKLSLNIISDMRHYLNQ